MKVGKKRTKATREKKKRFGGGGETLKRRRHRKIVKSEFNRKKYGEGKRKKNVRLSKRKRIQMKVSCLVVAGRNRRSAAGRWGM